MKNIVKYLALVAVALGMASCVHNLNTTPIDKNSTTGFNQDAIFTKIYATLGTTGQTGAAGSGDVDDIDEGWSGLFRVTWVLNGFPTDEGWWIWNDVGVDQTRVMSWDGENALIKCLYFRCMIDAKYCNHFLAYADSTSQKDLEQRAEVRFIRALNYWYLLDMFKFAPFMVKESTDPENYPIFMTRTELFEWLEKELLDLTTALPATRLSTYRVDQTAAWLLLARLYLNAEVYTGQEHWHDAYEAADKAIKSQYQLHTTDKIAKGDGTRFSAYQQLFMGDNDVNGAQNEAVLLVYQDGKYCRSYGGVQYAIAATRDGGMTPWGVAENWKCFRTSPEMVDMFVTKEKGADTIKANEYQMPLIVGDDRAILCSYVEGNPNKWKLSGGMAADFYASWGCPKFTAVYSTADSLTHALNSDANWPDTDIPLMRLAEAYLTRAEAHARENGNWSFALEDVNTIRDRAHAKPLDYIDEETMCDEWCREFWGEGRRRIDLIRFNRFAGPKADENQYHWEGRGGAKAFKSVEEKFNWYPVPSDDKRTNPNFKKQVIDQPGALEGGDGYTYAN
jgi:hypothetical protein